LDHGNEKKAIMRARFITLGLLFAFLAVSPSQAQVAVNVAKITCRQFVYDQITDVRTLSILLSGYFNGIRHNTVIDIGEIKKNVDQVDNYCLSHLEMNLMDAVKQVLGDTK
jgi:hypothetical protein